MAGRQTKCHVAVAVACSVILLAACNRQEAIGVVDDTPTTDIIEVRLRDGTAVPVLLSASGGPTCVGRQERKAEILGVSPTISVVAGFMQADLSGKGGQYRAYFKPEILKSQSFWYVLCTGADRQPHASCRLSGIAGDNCFETHLLYGGPRDAAEIAGLVGKRTRP